MTAEFALISFMVATPVALAVILFDLKTMTIPNWLTGGAFVVFAVLVFFGLGLEDALTRLMGAGIVLVVSFIMFAIGGLGGGDAKAATAFALLIAPVDAGFVLMALAINGLLGVGVLFLLRRTPLADGNWKMWSEPKRFPYGLTLGATLILYTALVAFLVN